MIAEFDDSKSKNWVEGASLSIQELHINYGLPREEIEARVLDAITAPTA